MSKSPPSAPATPERAAYSSNTSAAVSQPKASAQPIRTATSARIRQSSRACPGAGRSARWRLMRRSELVTLPSFSPQPVAGSSTSANRVVSVSAIISLTTTKSQAAIARDTRSASGIDTAGLVQMIHSALMRPSSTARNISTAFRPGLSAIAGLAQNSCTALRCAGLSSTRWQASMFANPPTSRPPIALGWPVTENGPMPGRPMRPVARWQFRIALTLSVPDED